MKFINMALVLFSLLCVSVNSLAAKPLIPDAEKVRAKGDLLVATTGMNLRKEPALTGAIIRQAERHEVVMVESLEITNGFVNVRLKDGTPAWAFVKYLHPINQL